jgi:hypothetical protein
MAVVTKLNGWKPQGRGINGHSDGLLSIACESFVEPGEDPLTLTQLLNAPRNTLRGELVGDEFTSKDGLSWLRSDADPRRCRQLRATREIRY